MAGSAPSHGREGLAPSAIVQAAKQRAGQHKYKTAQQLLEQIPKAEWTPEIEQLHKKVVAARAEVKQLQQQIPKLVKARQYAHLLPVLRRYLRLKPHDPAANQLLKQLQRKLSKRRPPAKAKSPGAAPAAAPKANGRPTPLPKPSDWLPPTTAAAGPAGPATTSPQPTAAETAPKQRPAPSEPAGDELELAPLEPEAPAAQLRPPPEKPAAVTDQLELVDEKPSTVLPDSTADDLQLASDGPPSVSSPAADEELGLAPDEPEPRQPAGAATEQGAVEFVAQEAEPLELVDDQTDGVQVFDPSAHVQDAGEVAPVDLQVVGQPAEDLQVLDDDPADLEILDQQPEQLQPVDASPEDLQVVDQPPPGLEMLDEDAPELEVLDDQPGPLPLAGEAAEPVLAEVVEDELPVEQVELQPPAADLLPEPSQLEGGAAEPVELLDEAENVDESEPIYDLDPVAPEEEVVVVDVPGDPADLPTAPPVDVLPQAEQSGDEVPQISKGPDGAGPVPPGGKQSGAGPAAEGEDQAASADRQKRPKGRWRKGRLLSLLLLLGLAAGGGMFAVWKWRGLQLDGPATSQTARLESSAVAAPAPKAGQSETRDAAAAGPRSEAAVSGRPSSESVSLAPAAVLPADAASHLRSTAPEAMSPRPVAPVTSQVTADGLREDRTAVSAAPAGRGLVQTVQMPEVAPGLVYTLGRQTGWTSQLAFSPDGRYLAAASTSDPSRGPRNTTIDLWDVTTGRAVWHSKYHAATATQVRISADNRTLWLLDGDSNLVSWTIPDGKLSHSIGLTPLIDSMPLHFSLLSAAHTVVLQGSSNVYVLDVGNLTVLHKWYVGPLVYDHAVSDDQRRLIAFERDAFIILDLEKGTRLAQHVRPPIGQLRGFGVLSDNGSRALMFSEIKVKVWQLDSGTIFATLQPPGAAVRAALSQDGRFGCIVSSGKELFLYDFTAYPPKTQQLETELPVIGAVFSPDPRFLATAMRDGTVMLWRLPEDWQPVGTVAASAPSTSSGEGSTVRSPLPTTEPKTTRNTEHLDQLLEALKSPSDADKEVALMRLNSLAVVPARRGEVLVALDRCLESKPLRERASLLIVRWADVEHVALVRKAFRVSTSRSSALGVLIFMRELDKLTPAVSSVFLVGLLEEVVVIEDEGLGDTADAHAQVLKRLKRQGRFAEQAVKRLLLHPSPKLRRDAADVLATVGTAGDVEVLKQVELTETDRDAKVQLRRARHEILKRDLPEEYARLGLGRPESLCGGIPVSFDVLDYHGKEDPEKAARRVLANVTGVLPGSVRLEGRDLDRRIVVELAGNSVRPGYVAARLCSAGFEMGGVTYWGAGG